MLYDVDYSLAGLFFLILLFVYLHVLYPKKTASLTIFRNLLLCVILADFFDIITCYTISFPYAIPLWLNYILNITFFEFNILSLSMLPKYVDSIIPSHAKHFVGIEKINECILYAFALICISTPYTHSIFYFTANHVYLHGSIYLLVYLLPFYFIVCSFIKLVYHKEFFNNRQFYSIIVFMLIAMSGPILQMLSTENKLWDFFMMSIATSIIIFGLETPNLVALEEALAELEENKKLLERANEVEEERNKLVHEFTKSASWSLLMDEAGQVLEAYWSDEFFWLLGYDRPELSQEKLATLWGDSLHPDDSAAILAAFKKGMEGIEPYDEFYRLRDKNDNYRWYRGTGETRNYTKNGKKVTLYHGIIQDVHEEKEKELLAQEKLATMEELEKSQAALKEAVLKAQAADKAKSEFLANMSHEIRTPINAVLGMNELISRESTEEAILSYSANITDASHTLLSLINDILDFSKIEAGRMELVPSEYQLAILLREIGNMIRIRCTDKNIKFGIKLNPEIPNLLYGDEVRIRQILLNVLNNAVKYTDKGSVTLGVDYELSENGTTTLIFTSKDTGIGIKEEDLPLLFESFKRIDLQHNRAKEGTGLGLNITKSLLALMDGEIGVTSTYGEGSTFTIRIPQRVVDATPIRATRIQTTPSKAASVPSLVAPTAKILVVDDVFVNLKVVEGLLKPTVISVDVALSGQECLEKIAETKYDLIFLDHMMPEMDGIETLAEIHKDTSHPNQDTPVIMLTANAIMGAKEEYLKQGFVDYLSKPILSDDLNTLLRKHLPSEKIEDIEQK